MIFHKCNARAEFRDCTEEELNYGLCDFCISDLRKQGKKQYKEKVRETLQEAYNQNKDADSIGALAVCIIIKNIAKNVEVDLE